MSSERLDSDELGSEQPIRASNGAQSPRPEQAACSLHESSTNSRNPSDQRFSRPAEAFSDAHRTTTSELAETSFVDWSMRPPSMRPMAVGLRLVGDIFNDVLKERWLRGDLAASNVALAERFLDVSEKRIREWRTSERSIPSGVWAVLPIEIVEAFWERLIDLRNGGRPGRRALTMIRRALPKLRALAGTADRYEAMAVLVELQKACGDIIAELAKEPNR